MTRIIFFGSSIEHGFWGEKGGWVQRLRRDLDRYSLENEQDYSLYNLSISGDTTERVLDRMENEIEARKNSEGIDIYLQIGGGNDSQVNLETGENWVSREKYRENVEKCLDIAEEYADKILLFTTTPVDESRVYPIPWKETHGYLNSEKEDYTEILRQKTEDRKIPLIDLYTEINEREWEEKLEDGVHPNTEGHKQLYRIAKNQLKEKDLIPGNL